MPVHEIEKLRSHRFAGLFPCETPQIVPQEILEADASLAGQVPRPPKQVVVHRYCEIHLA